MKKVKGLKFYIEEVTAEKKYKLKQDSIYTAGSDPLKIQIHLSGRIFGKFLWDRALCQKVCKALGVLKKDLTYKDESGNTELQLDFLTGKFSEFTGHDSYWANLQKMLDIVASYNYGKQVKKYEYDEKTTHLVDTVRQQIDFRIQGALELALRKGIITEEEYHSRWDAIKNIITDEQVYVPCSEEPKKVQLNGRGHARFLKDRNSYLKVCRVLGITKKELFHVEDSTQLYNVDLVQSRFLELTDLDEYWDIVQRLLDTVATYRYGKKKKYVYDQKTELEFQDNLELVNRLLRECLNNALLAGRIDPKKYTTRMDKLRAIFVDEVEVAQWKPLPEPVYLSSDAREIPLESSLEVTQCDEKKMMLSVMSEEDRLRREEDIKIATMYGLVLPTESLDGTSLHSNKNLYLSK